MLVDVSKVSSSEDVVCSSVGRVTTVETGSTVVKSVGVGLMLTAAMVSRNVVVTWPRPAGKSRQATKSTRRSGEGDISSK